MNELYTEQYYRGDGEHKPGCGVDYANEEVWLAQFDRIAKKIAEDFAPVTVLDMGCAWGYLVSSLRNLGVEAYGVDISSYAISMVRDDIKPFCAVASATDELPGNFPKKFDLLVTIEMIEHLHEEDGLLAMERLCLYSDRILFSSSPDDIVEATHFNVQQPEYWSKKFAKLGFFRNVNYAPSYISKNAVLFEKEANISRVIENYEHKIRLLNLANKMIQNTAVKSLKASIYFDTGKGFSEDEKKVVPYSGENFFCRLDVPNGLIRLRFDPMDGIICIVKHFEVTTNQGILPIMSHNGSNIADFFIFTTNDPQFRFEILKGIAWVQIEAKIYRSSERYFPVLASQLKQVQADLLKNVKALEGEKKHLQETLSRNIEELKDEKKHLQETLSESIKELEGEKKHLQETLSGSIKELEGENKHLQETLSRNIEELEGEKKCLQETLSRNIEELEGEKKRLQETLSESIKELEGENKHLQEILSKNIEKFEERNKYLQETLSKNIKELKGENKRLGNALVKNEKELIIESKTVKEQTKTVKEQTDVIENLQKEVQHQNLSKATENKKHQNIQSELRNRIIEVENSIRYRIGEAFVEAARPSLNTLKLPFRLFRLFIESRSKDLKTNAISKILPVTTRESIEISQINNMQPSREYDYELPRPFDGRSCEAIIEALKDTVSIVVPVYNAFEDTKLCIESVLQHTQITYELLLIDDCSTDSRISELLKSYESNENIRILRNEINLGFVKTVNRGFAETKGDVILLNSDTIVTERWILKLLVSAYSSPEIATVTPVSNAAGAFSVPDGGINKPIPPHLTLNKMAKIAELASDFSYPEVHTGNGFCMYIKRDVLSQIGSFDAETFGMGYGEENDFCMRAVNKGWKHLINDSVYIYHKRTASFSDGAKENLLKKNMDKLNSIHPAYRELNKKFFTDSSALNSIRRSIGSLIESPPETVRFNKKNILYVLHSSSNSGTVNTNNDLISDIDTDYCCYLLTSDGKQIRLWVYNEGTIEPLKNFVITKWNVNEFYSPEMRNIYFNVLVNLNISVVHIRHLVSHTFDLPKLADAMGIPVILSFHDFYFLCPSVQLVNGEGVYCSAECTSCKKICTSPYGWISQDVSDLRKFIPKWRKEVSKMLSFCKGFVTTSPFVKELHCKVYPSLRLSDFRIIEHGRDFESPNTMNMSVKPAHGEKIKILILGNIDYHKGGDFIQKLKKLDKNNRLEFHFLGRLRQKYREARIGIDHGQYSRDELPSLVEAVKPSFAGIFSIWPETYCHTLSEVWAFGIPTFVSDIGVLRERVLKTGGGWLLDFNDPKSAYEKILEVASNPKEYARVKADINRITMRTIADMAFDYKVMYLDVMNNYATVSLGIIIPGRQASSYVRVLRPYFHDSVKEYAAVKLIDAQNKSIESIFHKITANKLDSILVQRTALNGEIDKFINYCKKEGIKILLELDDDILNIDSTHSEYEKYKTLSGVIKKIALNAEIITVSTNKIRDVMSEFGNVEVIHNCLDEFLWVNDNFGALKMAEVNKITVGYIGTRTHKEDINMLGDAVTKSKQILKDEYGIELVFEIIGGLAEDYSWFRRIKIPEGCTDYPKFAEFVKASTLHWDFVVAPLIDSPVNRGKSAVKFLEYSALGLPGIYSAMGEYAKIIKHNETGILLGSNENEAWIEAICKMAIQPDLRETLAVNANRYVQDNYLLKNNVHKLINIIRGE